MQSATRVGEDEELPLEDLASIGLLSRALVDELRAPMMGALACAQALQAEATSPARVAAYGRATEEAIRRMESTLESLGRVASGPVEPERVSVRDIAELCVTRTLAAAKEGRARLTLRLSARRAAVHADRGDAERALFHLLSVWLRRAAPRSEVILETHARGGFMGFMVRQADLLRSPRAFEPLDSRVPLAVAKRLAARNGGRLEIKDLRAEGMILWLPLYPPEARA